MTERDDWTRSRVTAARVEYQRTKALSALRELAKMAAAIDEDPAPYRAALLAVEQRIAMVEPPTHKAPKVQRRGGPVTPRPWDGRAVAPKRSRGVQ